MKTVHFVPLPFFHVIYDCDTTVPVSGNKSKKIGLWYSANDVITELKLAFGKLVTVEYYFENFVEVLQSLTCAANNFSRVWKVLYTHGNLVIENIPPPSGFLRQYILGSSLQNVKWHSA